MINDQGLIKVYSNFTAKVRLSTPRTDTPFPGNFKTVTYTHDVTWIKKGIAAFIHHLKIVTFLRDTLEAKRLRDLRLTAIRLKTWTVTTPCWIF